MQSLTEEIEHYHAMENSDFDAIDFYNQRVDKYEDVILAAGHTDPDLVADTIKKLELPHDCSIMEFGCGTGLFGEAIAAREYTNVDGLDGSEEMLKRAQA